MAHFAKLDENNVVIEVLVVGNADILDSNGDEREEIGVAFLASLTKHPYWKKTSINTNGNVHHLGGTPFRKNFAREGYTYSSEYDAFFPPQRFPSWTLDTEHGVWKAPKDQPLPDGKQYTWDEENQQWNLFASPDEISIHTI